MGEGPKHSSTEQGCAVHPLESLGGGDVLSYLPDLYPLAQTHLRKQGSKMSFLIGTEILKSWTNHTCWSNSNPRVEEAQLPNSQDKLSAWPGTALPLALAETR